MFEKLAMKQQISDEEIIQLYRLGISQKDIVKHCPVDVVRTHRVLKNAGFLTHLYRKTNDYIINSVIGLINSGCTYYGIEEKCDISFHSVREIVEKNHMKGKSQKARQEKNNKPIEHEITDQITNFIKKYRMGYSYMKLCRERKFTTQQGLIAYNLISEADIKEHRENMKSIIISLQSKGLSAASIAGQLDISPAIVRKTISERRTLY